MTFGTLYLVPNTLDLGTAAQSDPIDRVLPGSVIAAAAGLEHWVAENAKSTRAFLKRIDAVATLRTPIQSVSIVEIPRPPKGPARGPGHDPARLLQPALDGHDLGLISEAGLPAVADPGAAVVRAAHEAGVRVVALAGPTSLMLALAASGLDGQSFAFVGYLPIETRARAARIRELEAVSHRASQTQLMIETPYRNEALKGALLANLQPSTRFSVSCGLTLPDGFTRTDSVQGWKSRNSTLPADVPAVFSLLA